MAIRGKKIQDSKTSAIKLVRDKITGSSDFIFTDYRGLTVEQITALRTQLREKNAEYHVIKNNFARLAFEELKYPDVSGMLTGPTAIIFSRKDTNEVAKALLAFAKETPAVSLKGGIVDKSVYSKAMMEAFSRLPSRNELISMLMSAMIGPVQNFVYVLNAVPTKLVRTLQAVADQKAQG